MTLFEASLQQTLILSFFIRPILGLLEPYVQQLTQWLTSSALHRKIVKVIIAFAVFVLLIGISFAAYLSFYWLYIPQRGHVGQVHLQYGKPTVPGVIGEGPKAEVDFTRGGRYGQFLRADQAYDISVNLLVPASKRNVEIGNFMVVVTLLRADGRVVRSSSRPAILTYQSTPLKLMRTAWKAVPLVLDWSKEDQIIKVPLIENFVEDSLNPVTKALVSISTPELQVYRSTIHIDAHFQGLRYFMYYWKGTTALVFMGVFVFWEIIFSIITWQVLAGWFGTDAEALAVSQQIRPHPDAQHGGQPGQQQLRAPTTYSATPSTSATRAQIQATGLSPRQPQSQEQGQGYRVDSDSEFEEESQTPRDRKGELLFDHDEMEDDEDEDEDEQQPQQLDPQGHPFTFSDDAVVPERPPNPSQRSQGAGAGVGAASSTPFGSRSARESGQQQRTTATTTSTVRQQQPQPHRGVYPTLDDETSTVTSISTSGSRAGRSAMDVSMTSSSPSLQPPPPPPPSVLSERSSDFQMTRPGVSRRTAVESEYTEEDDEYLEGVEDDEDEDDVDVIFGEEDFTEAGLLSRSSPRSGSVRSRHVSGGRGREGAPSADSGRSTARVRQ
ncbi:Berardinelli-Seip congenital lipodystrophy 2 (seipin) [Mortierella alpina]|uniref:Berardinelli-Seip congenital lipodystrophy 2 (Seipin) n=1 Tax=Mortierella alpina TaxID=64518 RepID=A0A9P6LWQ1_MORAP|nr:Berardinelli-Seip congenital lipodystrophy 2 (seipin) [Mortierella alpina]